MPEVKATARGFHIKKAAQDIKRETVASKGKKANRTDTERLERCELMLELLCEKNGIHIN